MRRFIIWLAQLVFKIITRTRIDGIEKIPTDEPAILTGNHIGILDGIMIPSIPVLADHPNLVVVVAEKYEENAFFRSLFFSRFIFVDPAEMGRYFVFFQNIVNAFRAAQIRKDENGSFSGI